jgi:hypothetical protein
VKRARGVRYSNYTLFAKVAQLIEGKPEDTERFAIKQLGHQRGTGTLPRGTWTRDSTKDNKVAPPP